MRTVVLASGAGTNFEAVLLAIASGGITNCEICGLIVDRKDSGAAKIASRGNIPVTTVDHKLFQNRSEFDSALFDAVILHKPELVLALGFMRVLSKSMIERFPNRIINIHPSLLPAFPGLHAVRQALEYGARVTGVTVHFVDASVDTGPIIAQKAVPIPEGSSVESLLPIIHREEHSILTEVVNLFCNGQIAVDGRKVTLLSKD